VAYDQRLADRIREAVGAESLLTEQRMFGGLAFLIGGNMAVAASGQVGALIRVDPAESARLITTTAAEPRRVGWSARSSAWTLPSRHASSPRPRRADADRWALHGTGMGLSGRPARAHQAASGKVDRDRRVLRPLAAAQPADAAVDASPNKCGPPDRATAATSRPASSSSPPGNANATTPESTAKPNVPRSSTAYSTGSTSMVPDKITRITTRRTGRV
jgi:hypothetical protein